MISYQLPRGQNPMVVRSLVHTGSKHTVRAALAGDGMSQPAMEYLRLLESRMLPLVGIELPDDQQVGIYHRLIAKIKRFADGKQLGRTDTNELEDGVFEFKHDVVRISFFDTDGVGSYTPKAGEWFTEWDGKRACKPPTDFDREVRLGHSFEKVGRRAEQSDIDQCIRVRREDVAHDKAN